MPNRLQGRIAIITGSSSGLGREIALAYASEGAKICCVDLYPTPRNPINPSTGQADDFNNRLPSGQPTHTLLAETFPSTTPDPPYIYIKADITLARDVEDAVRECVSRFGRLDIMVNNAGISVESTHTRVMKVHETSEEDWDRTMAINARGMFLGCKYACGQMMGQEPLEGSGGDRGWIVNTVSVQGMVAYHGTPSYCASKGAALMLTRQAALDYAPYRIHCNALCPGFLRTIMTQNLQSDPDKLAAINAAHPLGGMGDPKDVARAAVFLASDDARWVTGVGLPVDGGYTVM